MKKIISKLLIPVFMLSVAVAPLVLSTSSAGAVDLFPACSGNNKDSTVCKSTGNDDISNLIRIVVNTMLYILGAIAVIMIVVGGIRYATSNGDASGIKGAKDTILYAVIGLIVAMLAWAIVNFVIGRF